MTMVDPLPAAAAPGDVDTGFGSGGSVITDFGGLDAATDMAVQADGKIVVAGRRGSNEHDFALARYSADGLLDSTFDNDGRVTTDFGSTSDLGSAVVIQNDGRIVVAGQTFGGTTGNDFALARYNANGSLDPTFDLDGKVIVDVGNAANAALDLAVQSDGKIVVVGHVSGAQSGFAVVRLTSTGALDSTFDGDGRVTTSFGPGTSFAQAVALQPDGRIVVVGSFVAGNGPTALDFAIARYSSNGSLDSTFDTDGKVTTDFAGNNNDAYDVVVQRDGKLVVVGSVGSTGSDFAVVRYDPTGSLDAGFGVGGRVVTDMGFDSDVASGVALQANGKIVVTGNNGVAAEGFFLARYDTAGALDTTFGSGGKVATNLSVGDDGANSIAIQSDGRILAAGFSGTDFALVRYLGDPVFGPLHGDTLTPSLGYVLAASDGGVFAFNTPFVGSMGATRLNSPIVGMARGGNGYWLVAADGGVFAFGVPFSGSTGAIKLNSPIVGMAADRDGKGYWLVAADGGVFAFDAPFSGSTEAIKLNSPIVGMQPDPDGRGYWLVAADGGVFAFDAAFSGSAGAIRLNRPVVGMAADFDGKGYWLVSSDGGVFSFDATFSGSTGSIRINQAIKGVAADPDGRGYWMVASDGGVFSFDAPFLGSTGALALAMPVVGMAASLRIVDGPSFFIPG